MPDRGVAPIRGRAVDREGVDHLSIVEGRRVGGREVGGRHAVASEPGARIALFKHGCEHGVVDRAGRRDEHGVIALVRPFREEALIAGGVHAVDRDPSRPGALHPHRGVQRVARVAVDAERDHPIALGQPFVEVCLMLGGRDAVIGLEQHGVPPLLESGYLSK